MEKHLLYKRIAGILEQQIKTGAIKIGDKVPSIRTLALAYGVSQSTAMQALYYLESSALIVSRPKSGFFVCSSPKTVLKIPSTSVLAQTGAEEINEALVSKVYANLAPENTLIPFSLGMPAEQLLPVAKLNKGMVKAMREMPGSGVLLDHPQGNTKLRQQIVRWSYAMEANLHHHDIIITSGCLHAISLCLMAITKPGDRIAIESPVSFGIIQLAKSLKLTIVELPTHPIYGIELAVLDTLLMQKKIDVCLFIPNFSNPLGCCMPDENKRALVKLLDKYQIPLIENDLFGDLYFGEKRPKSCKTYDKSGMVLWCSSVSKSLAPGYRVGWVEAGRFKDQVLKMKTNHSIASPAITQEVVADFLESGRYETHLRKLRATLYSNYLNYVGLINDCFPVGTLASRPQGGFVLWLEMDKKINTIELFEQCAWHGLSIAPGKIFTLTDQFGSCMRLNYGLTLNDEVKKGLITIGNLAKKCVIS